MENDTESPPADDIYARNHIMFVPTKLQNIHQQLNKFPSRYIVEKKNYLFSPTRMILVIGEQDISLYALSRYPTSQIQQQRSDSIDYRYIERIQLDQQTSGELTITTTTNSQYTLTCKERELLLTEIQVMRELSIQRSVQKATEMQPDAYLQLELIDEEAKKTCLLKCHALPKEYYLEVNIMDRQKQDSSDDTLWTVDYRYLILYCEIEFIQVVDNALFIVQKNSDIDKLILRSPLLAKNLSQQIKEKASMNLRKDLSVELERLEEGQEFDQYEFLTRTVLLDSNPVIQSFDAEFVRPWDRAVIEANVLVTPQSVLIIDKGSLKTLKIAQIKDVKYLVMSSIDNTVRVIFGCNGPHYSQVELRSQSSEEIICSILTTHQSLGLKDRIMILQKAPDLGYRLAGLASQDIIDQDYNINLMKRVLDDYSEASIDEFLINSNFSHQPKLERQLLQKLKQLVEKTLTKDPMMLQDYNNIIALMNLLLIVLQSPGVRHEMQTDHQEFLIKISTLISIDFPVVNYLAGNIIMLKLMDNTRNTGNPARLAYDSFKNTIFNQVHQELSIQRLKMKEEETVNKMKVITLFEILRILIETSDITSDQFIKYQGVEGTSFVDIIDDLSFSPDFFVKYYSSRNLESLLDVEFKSQERNLRKLQKIIVNNSVQMINHVKNILESVFPHQKESSINILSKVLFKQKDALKIFLRLFDRALLDHINTSILSSSSPSLAQLRSFFSFIDSTTVDLPTIQWNQAMQRELCSALTQEIQAFRHSQTDNWQTLQGHYLGRLTDITLYFTFDEQGRHKVDSNLQDGQRLAWNHKDFRVRYSNEVSMIKVHKYYLQKLLQKDSASHLITFAQDISRDEVHEFMDKLHIKLLSSRQTDYQIKVLQTMTLLYQSHHESLGDFRLMPSIIRLLKDQQYQRCHFQILELILSALLIRSEQISYNNIRNFVQAGGITNIINELNPCFTTLNDHIPLIRESAGITLASDSFSYIQMIEKPLEIQNTKLSLIIIKTALQSIDQISAYPSSSILDDISSKNTLRILANLLLLRDQSIAESAIDIIASYLNQHYYLQDLIGTGIIEFLILYMPTQLAQKALDLLNLLQ